MKEENEFTEDSYHAFLGKDGYWHADDTFYTEWYQNAILGEMKWKKKKSYKNYRNTTQQS